MSDENKDPDLQTWIDPELEARVVAWVVGEASEFEAAELARIIAGKPELGIFKRRIETVHGLVTKAGQLDLDPMRLSDERRKALLEKLRGNKPEAAAPVLAMPEKVVKTKQKRPFWKAALGIAACVAAMVMLAGLLLPAMNASKHAAIKAQLANMEAQQAYEAEQANGNDQPLVVAQIPVPSEPPVQAPVNQLAALNALKALASKTTDRDDYDGFQAGQLAQTSGEVNGAGGGRASEGYHETRSEQLWELDNGWAMPVHRFGVNSADASNRGNDATGAGANFSGRESARSFVTADGEAPAAAGLPAAATGAVDAQRETQNDAKRDIELPAPSVLGLEAAAAPAAATASPQEPVNAPATVGGDVNQTLGNSAPATTIAGGVAGIAVNGANTYTGASMLNGGTLNMQAARAKRTLQQQPITSGLRSGSYAISAQAIDSLLYPKADNGTDGETQAENDSSKQSPTDLADADSITTHSGRTSTVQATRRAADEPNADGQKFEGFINYGSPIAAEAPSAQSQPVAVEGEVGGLMGPRKTDASGAGNGNTSADIQSKFVRIQQQNEKELDMKALQGQFGVNSSANTSNKSKDATLAFNMGTSVAHADKVPILGDIPIPGFAFRSKATKQAPAQIPVQDEISANDQPFSTFSLHVSDVSFLLAKEALLKGQLPDPDSVRPEEFYNAFDYGDPAPGPGEQIACRIEQAAHPVFQQRNLVRIAMKVASSGRGAGQPLQLTVLLDTSGSMEREDREASVQQAMKVLTSLLGQGDAITLIGFGREPRLLAEEVRGDQAGMLVDIVKRTPPEGGTNMEEALKLATQLALRHYNAGGQNRVVMLTDGAANLGDADPEQLSKLVADLRQKGVSFDTCGVGANGLNDEILEALTRKGGGRYYFLNQPEDADAGFAQELAGAFRPAAENVKMQVRFNPARVGKYRLIGFDKNRLNKEDFRNDSVTAAQLAAEEAAVALYQVQVLPEGDGELGDVFVRFRDPASGRIVEQSWTIPYDPQTPELEKASPSMQLAAAASMLAEKLRGGVAGEAVDLDALEPLMAQLRGEYAQQQRVQDLWHMFEQVRIMTAQK